MNIEEKVNLAFQTIIQDNPELAKLFVPQSSPMMTFPQGLRYRFWRVHVGKREWKYCYSTTKNKNGKFLSWIYKPKGTTRWEVKSPREFRRRLSAKKNALNRSMPPSIIVDRRAT